MTRGRDLPPSVTYWAGCNEALSKPNKKHSIMLGLGGRAWEQCNKLRSADTTWLHDDALVETSGTRFLLTWPQQSPLVPSSTWSEE